MSPIWVRTFVVLLPIVVLLLTMPVPAHAITAKQRVAQLERKVDRLEARVDRLAFQRDQALAGLPAAILAVPIQDFPRLVFDPARQAWPCDSFFQGTGWSYTFENPSPYC